MATLTPNHHAKANPALNPPFSTMCEFYVGLTTDMLRSAVPELKHLYQDINKPRPITSNEA